MKCKFVFILMLVLTIMLGGCAKNEVSHEDTAGTTKRTQETVLDEVEAAYKEAGYIYFNPDIPAYYETFVEFLGMMEDSGSGLSFDLDSIEASFTGLNVQLKTPLDAWGHPMRLWVEMPDPEAGSYILAIASWGPDGEEQFLGTPDLTSGDGGDDIFASREGTADYAVQS